MEWLVQLTGENYDLEELSKSLKAPELTIDQEEGGYVLRSADLNNLNDADVVRQKASEILSLINGGARLTQGMRKPLEIAHVILVKDNGSRQIFVNLTEGIILRDSVIVVAVGEGGILQEVRQSDVIPRWVLAARHDENTGKVLRFFGSGRHDWVTLYKIYEVIRDDVGGIAKIEKNGWATEKAIKRFTQTANSPGAIGGNARHGTDRGTIRPKNPMSLSEAKSLIEGLAHSWLRSKT
jgi:hypothetical protein